MREVLLRDFLSEQILIYVRGYTQDLINIFPIFLKLELDLGENIILVLEEIHFTLNLFPAVITYNIRYDN